MPNDELSFSGFIDTIDDELHQALHFALNFPVPEQAHDPALQAGWGAGVLFGMHFACQYPKLAAQIERRVFLSHPELAGPQKAADVVAAGVMYKVLGKPPLTGDALIKRWEHIKDQPRETDVVHDIVLPSKPLDFYGLYSEGQM